MGKTGKPKNEAEAYVVKHPHLLNQHWTVDQINAHADACLDYFRYYKDEITISKYFTDHNIPSRSYARFGEKSEYFATIWEILKAEQKERLANMLMSRDNSTAGIIFAMKNVTEWRDQPQLVDDSEEFELIDDWSK